MPNQQRMEALQKLSPLEAVQVWLDGDFSINDEPALCAAIRKDFRITLSDSDIIDIILESMDDECNAEKCLERLATPP